MHFINIWPHTNLYNINFMAEINQTLYNRDYTKYIRLVHSAPMWRNVDTASKTGQLLIK